MALSTAQSGRPLFRAPLAVGDIAPECALPTADGKRLDIRDDRLAGYPMALAFLPRLDAAAETVVAALAARVPAFEAAGGRVLGVSMAAAKAAAAPAMPFPLLLDRDGKAFAAFAAGREQPSIVVLRQNAHVAAILKGDPADLAERALARVQELARQQKQALE